MATNGQNTTSSFKHTFDNASGPAKLADMNGPTLGSSEKDSNSSEAVSSSAIHTAQERAQKATEATLERLEHLYDRTQGFFQSLEAREVRDKLTQAAPFIGAAVGVIGIGVAITAARNNSQAARNIAQSLRDVANREQLLAALNKGTSTFHNAQSTAASAAQNALSSASNWTQDHNPVSKSLSLVSPITTKLSRVPSSLPAALVPLFFSRTLGPLGLRRTLRNPIKSSLSWSNPFASTPQAPFVPKSFLGTALGIGALVGAELIARRFGNMSLLGRAREEILKVASNTTTDSTASMKQTLQS